MSLRNAARLCRLVLLMLTGAFLGWGFLTQEFVKGSSGYDHGQGETAECAIYATVVGALLGLGIDLIWRFFNLPNDTQ